MICKDNEGQDYLCGVVSFGVRPCEKSEYPIVFTNVGPLTGWIENENWILAAAGVQSLPVTDSDQYYDDEEIKFLCIH